MLTFDNFGNRSSYKNHGAKYFNVVVMSLIYITIENDCISGLWKYADDGGVHNNLQPLRR